MNAELCSRKGSEPIASLTGIDCVVQAVFSCTDDRCTCILNTDYTIDKMDGRPTGFLTIVFPLTSNSRNVADVVFMRASLVRCENKLDISHLVDSDWNYPIVRIYSDIFLCYDKSTELWVFFCLITP